MYLSISLIKLGEMKSKFWSKPHHTYVSKPQALKYVFVIGFTTYIFNDNTDLLLVV